MKKLVVFSLFLVQILTSFGQTSTGFSAKVVDSKTQKALQGVIVTIQNTNLTVVTDATGKFSFTNAPEGTQIVLVATDGYKDQLINVDIVKNKILDLGLIVLEIDIQLEQQTNLVTITDNDLSDTNSGSESTASLLQASRDVFLQTAAFNFGQARFSVRGIDNENSTVMINGIVMNRLSDGRPQYSNWGGLNDATRNQEFTNGTTPSDYTFGGIAGTQEINTRASGYRPGNRVSFLSTNTNYNFRAMGTIASGMKTNGWAYMFSAGRRWAQEGYFDGTTYAANSIMASVEKRINGNHSINFTTIYAQNRRGKNSPDTKEVNDLVGVRYNSYWGYQEGEKRNSRVKVVDEPIAILSHFWKISENTRLNTNVSYQFGQIGNSRLDFQSAPNPDPTYYRNLPSYHTTNFNGNVYAPNNTLAEANRVSFLANPQLNWRSLYEANNNTLSAGSRYVLYEDRNDEKTFNANTILASQLSSNIFLNAGASYINTKSSNFKNLLDLLGGNFFNDFNPFGVFINQNQNDLNNPNRQVVVGDKYGYNYNLTSSKLEAFTQFKFNFKKVDFYMAQAFSQSSYEREGLYKNGYYPTTSFGKSEVKTFDNFAFKGGFTYKISGKHFIDINGLYMSKAPNAKDVFANTRLNNNITPNLTNEAISSADISYVVRTPKFKARLSGYFNEINNSTEVSFYYADAVQTTIIVNGQAQDSRAPGFVSEIVTGQNRRNRGGELGMEYQLTSTLKVTGVAAYGDYVYTNNPNLRTTNDANGITFNYREAKLAGYKVPGLPQQAYSLGMEYRDPKFWWIGANINYLSNNYVDIAPITRTDFFKNQSDATVIAYDQTLADQYLQQEKFNPFYLLNLVGGKSWRIKGNTLGLFANINNVLDATYKTGGFESARNSTFSELYQDNQGPTRNFGSRYFYGYGRTFMVNVYLNF